MPTGKMMCEYIARRLNETHPGGASISPEDIWNSHPKGELYPVIQLYEKLKDMERGPQPCPENPVAGDTYFDGKVRLVWTGSEWI